MTCPASHEWIVHFVEKQGFKKGQGRRNSPALTFFTLRFSGSYRS
jgi:hypothetical protein